MSQPTFVVIGPINVGDQVRLLMPVTFVTPKFTFEATPGHYCTVVAIHSPKAVELHRDPGVQGAGGGLAMVAMDQIEPAHQVVNGTYYSTRAHPEVINVLEWSRRGEYRIQIHHGFTERHLKIDDHKVDIGRDLLSEFETTGHVGRSMGPIKSPLMISTRCSMGGGRLLDDHIVKITTTTAPRRVLYQHPKYHFGKVVLRPCKPGDNADYPKHLKPLTHAVDVDGDNHAQFSSIEKAKRWLTRMNLTYTEAT